MLSLPGTKKGKTRGRIVKRAQMLLLADEGHSDETIVTMLKLGESTVHRTRQRCVEEGVEKALKERPLVFFQPLAGWRHIQVTSQRTAQDFAQCMKDLVDVFFPLAMMIRVVLDNLDTHTQSGTLPNFSLRRS